MEQKNNFLAEAPVGKLLVKFAVPCVLSLLVSALYNIVDQIFIGQSVGYLGNAATNVVYPFTVVALAVALLIGDGAAALFSLSLGIAVGGQPIVGYNYGSGNFARVRRTYRLILLSNVVVGAVATLLFELFPQYITLIFGSESDLYNDYACLCFRIFLGGILFCCVQKTSSIFLQSVGKAVKATLLSVSRDVLFLVPLVVWFALSFGVTGLLWAAPVADVLAFLLTVALVFVELRRMRRKEGVTVDAAE